MSEIRGSEIRGSEIRGSEIRISSNHRELHGAIFFHAVSRSTVPKKKLFWLDREVECFGSRESSLCQWGVSAKWIASVGVDTDEDFSRLGQCFCAKNKLCKSLSDATSHQSKGSPVLTSRDSVDVQFLTLRLTSTV